MKTFFSTGEVRHWIGSDHTSSEQLIQLITDLLNKEYSINQMRKDIIDSDLGDGDLDEEDEEDSVHPSFDPVFKNER
jgi:hypothetical protein